jgi:hypothetical protein
MRIMPDDDDLFSDEPMPPEREEEGDIAGSIDQEIAINADRLLTLDSSWLSSAFYSLHDQRLDIATRKGRQYTLFGVPPDLFLDFIDAPSPGEFFNANLKGKF